MSGGWIKIHRKISDWRFYKSPDVFRVFFHLIINANHKEGFTHDGTKLNAGQLMTSQIKLSETLKMNRGKLQRILKKLEEGGEIEQQTNFQRVIITITNWSQYQSDEQRPCSDRAASVQRVSTNKNAKNNKNEKKYKSLAEKSDEKSPLDALGLNLDILNWVQSGNFSIHKKLMAEYDHAYLKDVVEKAFYWQQENKSRKAGTFLTGWIDRDKNSVKKKEDLSYKSFFSKYED